LPCANSFGAPEPARNSGAGRKGSAAEPKLLISGLKSLALNGFAMFVVDPICS
jgi:hypothetical protein